MLDLVFGVQRTPCIMVDLIYLHVGHRFIRIAIHRSLKCLGSMLRRKAVASSTIAKYRQYRRQWCAFVQQMTWSRWLSPANACHRLEYFCNSSMVTRLEFSRSRQPTQYNSAEIISTTTKKTDTYAIFLRLLHRSLNPNRPRQRLVWGCLLIGYFFLLRRSEFLKIGKSYHFYCLKRRNAFFSDDEGSRTSYKLATSVTVGLEGAKNDQFGWGSWRTMSASVNKTLCPIQGLRNVFQARKLLRQEANPHLCAGLTVQSVVQVIKSTARRIGVPAAKYSSHSIRIGGATCYGLSIRGCKQNCYQVYWTMALRLL
ncbi:hypothetical protein PHMEG_00011350 [Phytophthora megakarya]|uniref:Tyr recombinase domain-containing protein n=1 Tax=Phytophthora megakarya TaxID=4795 RepID=A0A225WDH1_9STRA|nr:hypothetical protein PHMEG_00011350 [Phytophthora megakarya]